MVEIFKRKTQHLLLNTEFKLKLGSRSLNVYIKNEIHKLKKEVKVKLNAMYIYMQFQSI